MLLPRAIICVVVLVGSLALEKNAPTEQSSPLAHAQICVFIERTLVPRDDVVARKTSRRGSSVQRSSACGFRPLSNLQRMLTNVPKLADDALKKWRPPAKATRFRLIRRLNQPQLHEGWFTEVSSRRAIATSKLRYQRVGP